MKRKRTFIVLGGLLAFGLMTAFTLTLKAKWMVNKINISKPQQQYELYEALSSEKKQFKPLRLPKEEPNRLDILILGMRGAGEEYGGLLTDTIILLSVDKEKGSAALISIPRDLYIALPYNGKVKINEIYSIGLDKGGESLALNLERTVFSQLTGVYIDGVVELDFQGFQKLIDAVGGVDIYLEKPFTEVIQWQGKGGFKLPAGWNHLNGEESLFYVRSRFATSDFDRANRQQEIILALKNKITSLGILSNPLKIYAILNIMGNHIKTDFPISIPQFVTLANRIDYHTIKRVGLSTQNYLSQTAAPNGAYILVPKGGDFSQIQHFITNLFTQ